jgi:hypothetical protein
MDERAAGRTGRGSDIVKVSSHLFISGLLALLYAAASAPMAYAGHKKPKNDWDTYFGAGIAPAYLLSAIVEVTHSGDDHFSYTDGNGDTTMWHCSSTASSVDCADGPGVYFSLIPTDPQPVNGQPIYTDFRDANAIVPPLMKASLNWELSGDPVFQTVFEDAKARRVLHFRWTDLDGARLVCIPVPGTESIPDGNARKDYAKKHRMESCYFAQQAADNHIATKDLSPAFLAILAKVQAAKAQQ